MRTRSSTARAALLAPALFVVLAAGCANYYQVTDTSSGKVYFTKDVDRDKRTATVSFEDAKSGAEVTLPSSEVKEISKDEYKTGVGAK